jgi:hypothetical protein
MCSKCKASGLHPANHLLARTMEPSQDHISTMSAPVSDTDTPLVNQRAEGITNDEWREWQEWRRARAHESKRVEKEEENHDARRNRSAQEIARMDLVQMHLVARSAPARATFVDVPDTTTGLSEELISDMTTRIREAQRSRNHGATQALIDALDQVWRSPSPRSVAVENAQPGLCRQYCLLTLPAIFSPPRSVRSAGGAVRRRCYLNRVHWRTQLC